jgi:hypothetical protein
MNLVVYRDYKNKKIKLRAIEKRPFPAYTADDAWLEIGGAMLKAGKKILGYTCKKRLVISVAGNMSPGMHPSAVCLMIHGSGLACPALFLEARDKKWKFCYKAFAINLKDTCLVEEPDLPFHGTLQELVYELDHFSEILAKHLDDARKKVGASVVLQNPEPMEVSRRRELEIVFEW